MQHISLKIIPKMPGYDLYGAPGVLKGDFGGLYAQERGKKITDKKKQTKHLLGDKELDCRQSLFHHTMDSLAVIINRHVIKYNPFIREQNVTLVHA